MAKSSKDTFVKLKSLYNSTSHTKKNLCLSIQQNITFKAEKY